jgi:hypothetical protein
MVTAKLVMMTSEVKHFPLSMVSAAFAQSLSEGQHDFREVSRTFLSMRPSIQVDNPDPAAISTRSDHHIGQNVISQLVRPTAS